MAGDEKTYRELCRMNMEELKKNGRINGGSLFAHAAVLLPNVDVDYETVLKAAEADVGAASQEWSRLHAQVKTLYRLKRYPQALDLSAAGQKLGETNYRKTARLLWTAMCRHQLGEHEQAKKLLTQAVHLIDNELPGQGEFVDWGSHLMLAEVHIIRREAEGLILAK